MTAITKYQLPQYMSYGWEGAVTELDQLYSRCNGLMYNVMVSSVAVNKTYNTPEIPKHVIFDMTIEHDIW